MKINDLNSNYTFENFIVGNNNRFAYDRALEVANDPANVYNPFYIFGKNGLGKTHLMQAIGNKILQNNPKLNVCYMRINELLYKIIKSIKELDENNEKLLRKFNDIDVLMIDDIQFIAGKERCQDVFLKIFNKVYGDGKQIIIISDRHPEQIGQIKTSLQNRFIWGKIVDITMPDYETRLAILENKVKEDEIKKNNRILQQIAEINSLSIIEQEEVLNNLSREIQPKYAEKELFAGNYREVEKILSNLDKQIIINEVKKVVDEYIKQNEKFNSIVRGVEKYFNTDNLIYPICDNNGNVRYPRQIAMFLCFKYVSMMFWQKARMFNISAAGLYAEWCYDFEQYIKDKPDIKKDIKAIVDKLKLEEE